MVCSFTRVTAINPQRNVPLRITTPTFFILLTRMRFLLSSRALCKWFSHSFGHGYMWIFTIIWMHRFTPHCVKHPTFGRNSILQYKIHDGKYKIYRRKERKRDFYSSPHTRTYTHTHTSTVTTLWFFYNFMSSYEATRECWALLRESVVTEKGRSIK